MSNPTATVPGQPATDALWFLPDGVDMSARVRAHDWAATPLGPMDAWPEQLKTTVSLALSVLFPTLVWWGPELIQIYNDAACRGFDVYDDPCTLGQPAADCWHADWPTFAPQIAAVLETGRAARHQDMPIAIDRGGRREECYFTYSFTPLRGPSGAVAGILVTSLETTERVLAERRQLVLDQLRILLAGCGSRAEVVAGARQATLRAPQDIVSLRFPHEGDGAGAAPQAGTVVTIRAPHPLLSGQLELTFAVSDALPVDAAFRRFLEQFTNIVASTLQRVDGEVARAIAREERDRLLLDAPVGAAVMIGERLTYQLVNAMYAEVSGRPAAEMLGRAFTDVFPELAGSPVQQSFMSVYQAGIPFVGGETLVQIHKHGGALEDRYFTYNLSPLRRVDGSVYGLMVIAVDITVQVQARTQIERLNEELREASRAKDEFLALLGHELRNPLAPIVTALELMKLRDCSSWREQAVIERQINHLRRLVDDLLDVSRITRGKVELRKQVVALADVLGKAIEMVHPAIEKKHQKITIDVAPAQLLADPDRLAQMVSNLLTNATRYTPDGGHLSLSAWVEDSLVQIEMRDDGAGIPAALMPRIFDAFVQGERQLQGAVGGLGIGLALVRNLAELHGGSVSAYSAGEGQGSTFRLTSPGVLSGVALDAGDNTAAALAPPALQRPWDILVVDDNEDAAGFLAELLTELGHTVQVAHDPAAALAAATRHMPALAILDLGLPDMDGYQLAERLRALPGGAQVICVALSGYGLESDKARSREARFAAHLVKPVEQVDLLAMLDALPPL